MDNGKLLEIGGKLDVSEDDLKAMKHEKFKEKWLYPVTGAVVTALSVFLGWFFGRQDEREVSRETGREYPFSSGEKYCCSFLWGMGLLGIGTIQAYLKTRDIAPEERKRFFLVMIAVIYYAIYYAKY